MLTRTQTQKIEISTLKEKYNLTKEEKEAVEEFLAERRSFARELRKQVAGICGEKADYYHLPRIIVNIGLGVSPDASLMVLNYKEGAGKVLSTGINVSEAKDLIEKLKAYVELATVEGQINTYRYKVEGNY